MHRNTSRRKLDASTAEAKSYSKTELLPPKSLLDKMYTAEITVHTKTNLEKVFQSEEKNINERAHYTLTKNKDQYTFHIEAKDATALRTVISSITKVLSVHEKTLEVIEKNK